MGTYERYANWLTIILFITLTGIAVTGAISLPDSIPIHFNGRGEPNRWGSPKTLLFLPVINGCILGLFWAIRRYTPTRFMNIPGPRTPENVAMHRQNFNQFIATIQVIVTALFLSITIQLIWGAKYLKGQVNLWPSYLFIALLNVSLIIYVIKSYRLIPRQ